MLNHNLLVCKIVFKKLIEMILMKINEPVTMLTDYLITVYCLWLVFLIEIKGELNLENPMIIGSLLIGSIGISAFFGGSAHGWKLIMNESKIKSIWILTRLGLGLCTFLFILFALQISNVSDNLYLLILIIGIIQLMVNSYIVFISDKFLFTVINYLISLSLIFVLKLVSYVYSPDIISLWLIGSIGITFIGSFVQVKGISLNDKYFNHNDLYHIIQLPAIYCIYRAVIGII